MASVEARLVQEAFTARLPKKPAQQDFLAGNLLISNMTPGIAYAYRKLEVCLSYLLILRALLQIDRPSRRINAKLHQDPPCGS